MSRYIFSSEILKLPTDAEKFTFIDSAVLEVVVLSQ